MKQYADFLRGKIAKSFTYGASVSADKVNPILLPHQIELVRWAVEGGRRAIFAAFGLGKSVMQLETLRLTIEREGGEALIICPLGVRGEFRRDGRMLGYEAHFIRNASQIVPGAIHITNYETVRDGKLDPNLFTAVSLDEASILLHLLVPSLSWCGQRSGWSSGDQRKRGGGGCCHARAKTSAAAANTARTNAANITRPPRRRGRR